MRNKAARDLMVVGREAFVSPDVLEAEANRLNEMLNKVEVLSNVATAMEVADLNRYKMIRQSSKVYRYLLDCPEKSFVFFLNKN
ncbi:MAG: hypothetical protein MUF24_07645 [Chitinophagaceae bacterium]|jgi:hypothetical protein|nr:hypothetical protein [Chitinophagaceae bacterium]